MNEHKYRIIANDKEFLVKADGFKIDKDEGIITFFDILAVTIQRFKCCFVLNNIICISIIEEEEGKNNE